MTLKIERVRELVREIDGRPFEARVARDRDRRRAHDDRAGAERAAQEPGRAPPTSHVFLVTPSPQTLLPTIRSRCQTLRLGPLPAALLERALAERLSLTPAEARLRVSVSGGSLGQALAFEGEAYGALRDELLRVMAGWVRGGVVDRMEAAEALAEREDRPARARRPAHPAARRGRARGGRARRDAPERRRRRSPAPRWRPARWARARPPSPEAAGETLFGLKGNASKLLSLDVLLDTLR